MNKIKFPIRVAKVFLPVELSDEYGYIHFIQSDSGLFFRVHSRFVLFRKLDGTNLIMEIRRRKIENRHKYTLYTKGYFSRRANNRFARAWALMDCIPITEATLFEHIL